MIFTPAEFSFWLLVCTGVFTAAWWLTVRPEAQSHRAAGTVSLLVIAIAVLLSILAVSNSTPQPRRVPPTAFALGF